jgi:hypothetical protein
MKPSQEIGLFAFVMGAPHFPPIVGLSAAIAFFFVAFVLCFKE